MLKWKDVDMLLNILPPKVFNKLDHSGQRVLSHGLRCPWRVRGGEISTREGCKEDDPTNKNMTKWIQADRDPALNRHLHTFQKRHTKSPLR